MITLHAKHKTQHKFTLYPCYIPTNHRERKMNFNGTDSRTMSSSRFTVNKKQRKRITLLKSCHNNYGGRGVLA